MFTNLLINAFEALGGRGAHLDRRAGRASIEGDHTQPRRPGTACRRSSCEIADDGPGVPPEMVDRMFNPFFTTKAQGSGLGLAIVRKIVDAHDGRIDVSSAAGHGTRFTRDAAGLERGDERFGISTRRGVTRTETSTRHGSDSHR